MNPGMNRGRLSAYARWQLFDFFRDRSIAIILVGILIGFPIVTGLRYIAMSMPSGGDAMLQQMIGKSIGPIVMQLVPIFTLVTINKVVAGDRTQGYYRFLFAKPISVQRYYAQAFAVNGIGLLLCVVLLGAISHATKVPLPIISLIAVFAVLYIAMGGIGFLCSVLTRFDWQPMLVVWFGALVLYNRYGDSGGIGAALVHLLPPAHVANDVAAALFTSDPLQVAHLIWLLVYGAVCFGAGILVLRYRQFVS